MGASQEDIVNMRVGGSGGNIIGFINVLLADLEFG